MKNSAAPIFSIVIPTHNRPDTLARAISSVARQSMRDFELIVVDDCSSQKYAEPICKTMGIPYHVITNTSNLGAAGSRNAGIRIAKGKYISFLDDDDELSDSFLESTYRCLEDAPNHVGASWCSARCIDYPNVQGEPLIFRNRLFETEYESDADLFEQFLSIGLGFGVTIKASCLDKVGLFNEDLRAGEDTDMFLKILNRGFFPRVVPGIHVTLHNHRNFRLTSVAMHSRRIEEGKVLLSQYDDFLKKFPAIDKKFKDHLNLLQEEMSGT